MGTVFFLMMLFSFMLQITKSLNTNCSNKGPAIKSPFSLQEQNCSYPGFKLTCQNNQTIINFPSYGDLVVKSVSYDIKKLDLLDPKNCVHEVFLNLDLSGTLIDYYYVLKSYTYVNCSARLNKFDEIPCMSGRNYHVYVVEAVDYLPSFCRVVKTKGIPFSYSPYLSDNSFGLGFTWDLNGYEDCKLGGERFNSWLGRGMGFILIILAIAILISVTHCSKFAWNYSVANVNEIAGQDIKKYFGNENNEIDEKILLHIRNKTIDI